MNKLSVYIFLCVLLYVIFPIFVYAQNIQHVVSQGMIRDYRVQPEPEAINYIWEIYTDPGFLFKDTTGIIELIDRPGDNDNEIRVHWKTNGYFYLMVTIVGQNGCLNKKAWAFYVEKGWFAYAVDDTAYTAIDIPVWIDVLANDSTTMLPHTLQIIKSPESGYASVEFENYGVDYRPDFNFMGVDSFLYIVCDHNNSCDTARVLINVDDVVIPPQVFTPNDDGYNDFYVIQGLERYPENHFTVYNRWGNKVFEKENYNNRWNGFSNVKHVFGSQNQLPVGVYYYVLKYSGNKIKQGGLYLER